MLIVQSPKFWSNRVTVESSPVRSHFDGSFQASCGKRRARSDGVDEKMYSPRDSSCH